MNNLAVVWDSLGRHSQAESLYLELIEIRRRVLGEHHPRMSVTFTNLARMYERQRKYVEAERAYLAASRGYVRSLGPENEPTRDVVARLAKLYATWGKTRESAEWQAKLPTDALASRTDP